MLLDEAVQILVGDREDYIPPAPVVTGADDEKEPEGSLFTKGTGYSRCLSFM